MPLHLEEFSQPSLQGYIENTPPARNYLLAQFMPEQEVFDIDFAYQIINQAYAKAASITGWNASAPLRDTKSLEKAFAQVAKVQHAQRLDEKTLLSFNRPRTDGEKAQAVEYVYDLTDDLSQGVDDITEYMRAQAIYNGGIEYHDTVNDIHIEFEYDLPVDNRISPLVKWSEAGATPLTDLQGAVKQFQKENRRQKPAKMHMTSATESLLLQNEQIRTQVFGNDNGGRILTTENLRAVLTALGLPTYEINDDVVGMDSGDVQLLEDNKVVLMAGELGKTMVGPTVENNYETGKFIKPKIEIDPPAQSIIVGKAVFPALQRPQSIVIVSV